MALSDDLRKRVVEAVVFGRAVAQCGRQAFRCEHRKRGALGDALHDHGADFAFAFRGRDRRSGRIEAQRDYMLGLIRRTPDITLREIQERLIQNCGERFSVSVLRRLFDRHGVTFKKRPRTPRSSGAPTFWSSAGTGSPPNSILIPRNSSSSTRPALPAVSLESMDAAGADGACGPPSPTAITRPSPSLPVCAFEGLRRRGSTTGR